jgi:peptidoglycan-associated lipoprotein
MNMRFLLTAFLAVFLLTIMGAGCAKQRIDDTTTPPVVETTTDTVVDEVKPMVDDLVDDVEPMDDQVKLRAKETLADEKIFFDYDKFDLKSRSKDILRTKAGIMKQYPDFRMLIEGHCDERGTEEYNLALGERRARAAYEFLVLLGVSPSRLKMVSFGEERPAVMGSNEAAWSQNRRAEFKVFE